MAGKTISKRVLTPPFIASHPHLITPKPFIDPATKQPKGPPRFQLSMIFDPADLGKFRVEDGDKLIETDIKKLAVLTAKEQFPNLVDPNAFKAAFLKGDGVTTTKGWPFVDGDVTAKGMEAKGKEGADRFKGKCVINAKSYEDIKPILSYFDPEKKAWRQLNRTSDVDMKKANDLFQGGNQFGAELTLRCTQMKDSQGGGDYFLSFYINAVRFLKEGEPFGRKGMMDRFDGYQGGESPHDPTKGMSDEIPF